MGFYCSPNVARATSHTLSCEAMTFVGRACWGQRAVTRGPCKSSPTAARFAAGPKLTSARFRKFCDSTCRHPPTISIKITRQDAPKEGLCRARPRFWSPHPEGLHRVHLRDSDLSRKLCNGQGHCRLWRKCTERFTDENSLTDMTQVGVAFLASPFGEFLLPP